MISENLGLAEVREVEAWMRGETDFVDVGFGSLRIETYDGLGGGEAGSFRLHDNQHGSITLGRAALATALNDRIHEIRRQSGPALQDRSPLSES